jgi:predicted RNase H-like nuclease (RuvC/YqgF family)
MDPSSIIGLMGNIVQFVSLTYEILTCIRELNNSGGSQEIEQLELLVRDVQRSTRDISKFIKDEGNLSNVPKEFKDDLQSLKRIAEECDKIADELIGILSRFELKHSGWQRKLEAIKVSGEIMWKKTEIRELTTRLLELENRLVRWRVTTMLR